MVLPFKRRAMFTLHPKKFLSLWPMAVILLAGCVSSSRTQDMPASPVAGPDTDLVKIRIIAFNDLHGNLEPPRLSITASAPGGATIAVPAGGIAYMASAIRQLKAGNPNHAVISAGDLIGASPLISALFLDEPTIEAVNAIGIDFNAVGNHEFDKGMNELQRMQHGGCTRFTQRQPCALDGKFAGADFGFLAANTFRKDGSTLFPASGIKTFGEGTHQVKVGFIGLTLKNTPNIVSPNGVAGLVFKDEAVTANALIPQLKAQGADAIVVVIHQGGTTSGTYNDHTCPDLSGDIVPILDRLDPAVDVVVSGHTHRSYICDYGNRNPARPFLLTSAGQYGTLLTDINLTIDAQAHKIVAKSANNVIVQGEGFVNGAGMTVKPTDDFPVFPKDAAVDAIVSRYAAAVAPLAQRTVGRLTASLSHATVASGESPLGNLIADAQLAATRSAKRGGAQIALMNPGGVRADLIVPAGGGNVSYGQLFRTQPFGNNLVVKGFTGNQLRALLEQQFKSGSNTAATPRVLYPSSGLTYAYDLNKETGHRVSNMRLHGKPITDDKVYRVTMNSYLASGGDNFSIFNQGVQIAGGDLDVDALEDYLRTHTPVSPPATDRITRIDRSAR
jgi:5'-nucleotidase